MNTDWLAFWDSPNFIYANARHKDVHYRLIAKEIAALVPRPDARVLDYGAGEALHADLLAAAAGELLICEAAPGLRAKLEKQFAGNAKIRVVAPHQIAQLPRHSLDLIIVHSVAQYLTAAGASALFALFHQLLKPDGLLVVSDVIQPEVSAAIDAWALLRFGQANGFLLAALLSLIRTFFSDYRRLRSRVGITRYTKAAMIEKLNAAGFEAHRAPHNIGHNQARLSFYARPR